MRWRLLKLDWSYAIGELIIVTAGVLIALAIDQWNSDRLDRVEETRIVVDLRFDLEGYEFGRNQLTGKDAALARLRTMFAASDRATYDPRSLLSDVIVSSGYGWNQYRVLRTTFDDLLSSGRFGLIRSAGLRAQISAYYKDDETSADRIEERETPYPSLTYELAPRIDEFELDPAIDSAELERLAAAVLELDLDRSLTAELNLSRFVRQRLVALDAACDELIAALEAYLVEIR